MDQKSHVMKGLGVDVMDMALCRLFVLFCKWLFCFIFLKVLNVNMHCGVAVYHILLPIIEMFIIPRHSGLF